MSELRVINEKNHRERFKDALHGINNENNNLLYDNNSFYIPFHIGLDIEMRKRSMRLKWGLK